MCNRQQICCNSTQVSIHPLHFSTDGVRDGMEEEEGKAGEEGEAEEEDEGNFVIMEDSSDSEDEEEEDNTLEVRCDLVEGSPFACC